MMDYLKCYSYTVGCPPVRGLSYVQVNKQSIANLYHFRSTYISEDQAHHRKFCAKVGKRYK